MLLPETLNKVLEAVSKYAWAAFIMAAFVLFVPGDAAKQIGVDGIKIEYKGYFWLALVFTGTIAIGNVISYVNKKVVDEWLSEMVAAKRQNKKRTENLRAIVLRLDSLDDREAFWIKYCLFYNVQTLAARVDNVTAQSLCYKRILVRGSGSVLNLPFHIPDDVWRHLQEHRSFFLNEEEIRDPNIEKYLEDFRRSLF